MNVQDDPIAAQILDVLKRIFPPRCGFAVQRTSAASISDLFLEEKQAVDRAVPKRQREFAAGRMAARQAMAQIGKTPAPIPVNTDRSPHWPEGVVGSISHSLEIAVAVVASVLLLAAVMSDLGVLWSMLALFGYVALIVSLQIWRRRRHSRSIYQLELAKRDAGFSDS